MGTNDITGAPMTSKVGDIEKYSEGYDRIFGKKSEPTSNCELPVEETPTLKDSIPPHRMRVVAEKMALDEKINRLQAILTMPSLKVAIDPAELSLLNRQLDVMRQYSAILKERMDLWEQEFK